MAETTTTINGCDADIFLDDDADAPVDVSGSSNEIAMTFDNELGEYRTFGSRWRRRTECGKDASFTLQAVYSTAADEAFDLLKTWYFANPPGNRTLSVYLPNKNVGSDHYQGEMKVESLDWTSTAGEGDPIIVTAELKPDGEVTHTTAAT